MSKKLELSQAVQQLGLFSKDSIYSEFYDMTDEEITRMNAEMEEQQEKEMQQQQEQAAMAAPGPGEAGGQEPAENVPRPQLMKKRVLSWKPYEI